MEPETPSTESKAGRLQRQPIPLEEINLPPLCQICTAPIGQHAVWLANDYFTLLHSDERAEAAAKHIKNECCRFMVTSAPVPQSLTDFFDNP